MKTLIALLRMKAGPVQLLVAWEG